MRQIGALHMRSEADWGLGIATSSHSAWVAERQMQYRDYVDLDQLADEWRAGGEQPVILWLANSQVHGVNKHEEGQVTAPHILANRFHAEGFDLITISPPSAHLTEHYLMFEACRSRFPIRMVITANVFLNQRASDIRPTIHGYLRDPEIDALLAETESGRDLLDRYPATDTDASSGENEENDIAGLENTVQENCEAAINGWLDDNWEIWRSRERARAVLIRDMRRFRDTALRINATTRRPAVPLALETNLRALEDILAISQRESITAAVYIAPIRLDVPPPYFQGEYEEFKTRLETMANDYGAMYRDFDDIVDGELFGTHNSGDFFNPIQPDFWHFTAAGHEILAEAVGQLIADAKLGVDP